MSTPVTTELYGFLLHNTPVNTLSTALPFLRISSSTTHLSTPADTRQPITCQVLPGEHPEAADRGRPPADPGAGVVAAVRPAPRGGHGRAAGGGAHLLFLPARREFFLVIYCSTAVCGGICQFFFFRFFPLNNR